MLQAALYVAVASVLALALLQRAESYFAFAERATVGATLHNAQSALYIRLAQDRLQGTLTRERRWHGGNAFELARMEVRNYAGAIEAPEKLAALSGGLWAFDSRRGEMVYVPSHPRGLQIEGGGQHLRFRLLVPDDSAFPVIEPVLAYRWEP